MPTRHNLELGNIRPLRLFAIILAVLFAIEMSVMFVLPYVVPPNSSVTYGAMIDACLLTAVLAPLLWYLIVKPLQNLATTRRRLLSMTLTAHEDERRRIARDLHDSLGQSLTSLMVGLRTIEESSTESKVQNQARELRRIGGDTHDEVRRLARGLRPAVLDDLGLVPALKRYLDELESAHRIEVGLESYCQETLRFSDDVETAVFRIVQESTANAIRHGNATHVQVALRCDSNDLRIQIKDDGCGFDPAIALMADSGKSPFGLLSIHERACLLGGEAEITSQPGSGTEVRVRIPRQPLEGTHG